MPAMQSPWVIVFSGNVVTCAALFESRPANQKMFQLPIALNMDNKTLSTWCK